MALHAPAQDKTKNCTPTPTLCEKQQDSLSGKTAVAASKITQPTQAVKAQTAIISASRHGKAALT
jgi:hypothetical protein